MGYIRSYRKSDREKELLTNAIEQKMAGPIIGQSDSSVLRIASIAILNGRSFGDVQDDIEKAATKIQKRRRIISTK